MQEVDSDVDSGSSLVGKSKLRKKRSQEQLRWAVRTALEGDYMREVSKDNVYDVQKKV